MGRISPGPTRCPPGAERRLVPAKSNLKPQTYLGGQFAADPADNTSAIAMATGDTSLPPHSPTLRLSGGGLKLAACHILLALYPNDRGLCGTHTSKPPTQYTRHRRRWQRRHRRSWPTTSGVPSAGSTTLSAGRKEHPTPSINSSTLHKHPLPPSWGPLRAGRPFGLTTQPPQLSCRQTH